MAYEEIMDYLFVVHIVIFFATIYREIFTAKTNLFGQIMRIMEIFSIPLYIYGILKSLEHIELNLIRINTLSPLADLGVMEAMNLNATGKLVINQNKKFLLDKCSLSDAKQFSGKTLEWLLVEVAVFTFFILTMVITMFKSRCFKVGMDNSQ